MMRFVLFYLLLCLSTSATAWPDRPVRLLVPVAPGGGADQMARILARHWEQQFNQPVIVDNRGGAAGAVAFNVLLSAAPDGHTVLLMSNGEQEEMVRRNPLVEIQTVARMPITVSVIAALGIQDLNSLISHARRNPGRLHYGTGGVGSVLHVAAREFERMYSVSLAHVPYKGGAQAIIPMLSGETQVLFMGIGPMLGYRHNDRIKILAIAGDRRSPQAPEIATFAEQGSGFDFYIWYALVGNQGIPEQARQRMIQTVRSVDSSEYTRLGASKWTITRANRR